MSAVCRSLWRILALVVGSLLFWSVALLLWGIFMLAGTLGDCFQSQECWRFKHAVMFWSLPSLGVIAGVYAVGLWVLMRRPRQSALKVSAGADAADPARAKRR